MRQYLLIFCGQWHLLNLKVCYVNQKLNRHTGSQTDRQTDRQNDRQTTDRGSLTAVTILDIIQTLYNESYPITTPNKQLLLFITQIVRERTSLGMMINFPNFGANYIT